MATLTRLLLAILVALLPLTATAAPTPPKQEPAISIEITGDKEVPLVLYIVPWQNPIAPMPDPPQLDDPSLRPLTPCELSRGNDEQVISTWQCDQRQPN